ncbi:MAG TPA: hypothetical protein VGM07_09650 [Stellaceae bacterium]|jgi:hypothetical protein
MQTDVYIGPLIERGGKFSYDTFSPSEGLRHSFRYPRIEQARHDQRAMIAEADADPRTRVHVCETVAEFEQAAAGDANAMPDALPSDEW